MNPAYLIIDERGDYFLNAEAEPIKDLSLIQELQKNLRLEEDFTLTTTAHDQIFIVESFQHPLQIVSLEVREDHVFLQTKQQVFFEADPKKWSVDEWDQFNGLSTSGAPFILSANAQDQLFDTVDSFDDEGFSIGSKYIPTPPYFIEASPIGTPHYWGDIYRSEENPGWNLNSAAEAFKDMLPRLKLPKSRILVLGAGEGHDAALFAEAGHVVTAVDFSRDAIERGRNKYSHLEQLHFFESNIFNLPADWNQSFDLVIEHTCYCAIPPEQRNELIKVYRRVLHEEGKLMGVFFTMEKRSGPPFGATEWEIRKRTQDHFQYLFWGRLRNSIPNRLGRELFVLARKK